MYKQEEITLTRRAHLQTLLAAAVAASVPAGLRALAAEQAAAPDLEHLDATQAKTLLGVTRTLFPHDMLGDRFVIDKPEQLLTLL